MKPKLSTSWSKRITAQVWKTSSYFAHFQTLVRSGRLFDGVEFLKTRVDSLSKPTPDHRTLLNLLLEIEHREEAQKYYRMLVQGRAFDVELLVDAASNDLRVQSNEMLDVYAKQFPHDQRFRIGQARELLDKGQLVQAEEILRTIVQYHPDDATARTLWDARYHAAGKISAVLGWLQERPTDQPHFCDDWLTIGELLDSTTNKEAAINAYARGWLLDPNRLEISTKLLAALRDFASTENRQAKSIDDDELQNAIQSSNYMSMPFLN